jgi:anti-sigma factor RsiW
MRARISARLDDELSELEAAELNRHLGLCAACRVVEAEVRRWVEMLRVAPRQQPTSMVDVLQRRRGAMRPAQIAAACAAAFAAVSLAALRDRDTGPPRAHAQTNAAALAAGRDARRDAYFDSLDYERRLIAAAETTHGAPASRIVPL